MRYVSDKRRYAESGGTLEEFKKILCDEEVRQHAVRELVSGGAILGPGWVTLTSLVARVLALPEPVSA